MALFTFIREYITQNDGRSLQWSRDEHLQSAFVVGEMKRAVSNPQITIIFLVSVDVGLTQLGRLIHTHTHTHTFVSCLYMPRTQV